MSDPEDMDFKDPKKWTQWDEMHFMSGDVSSILPDRMTDELSYLKPPTI